MQTARQEFRAEMNQAPAFTFAPKRSTLPGTPSRRPAKYNPKRGGILSTLVSLLVG